MNAMLDLPLWSATDAAKLSACCQRIAQMADNQWRTKHEWAVIAECSEHATSARFSELRKRGYVVERRRQQEDGSGDRVGLYDYRISRAGS